MSGDIRIGFKYKELQAIKHALQTQISQKKYNVQVCKELGNMEFENRLEKDILEEEKLLKNITHLINSVKERWNIK